MALKPRLELRQRAGLALTPAMRGALSVLRMAPAELDEALDRAAARNPFLLRQSTALTPPLRHDADLSSEALTAPVPSFQQSLMQQLAGMQLCRTVLSLALHLVAELRDDGLLDTPLPELAKAWQVSLTKLEAALEAVQQCEPAGVGARDLAECLRLQLAALGLGRQQAADTVRHLDLFARADWAGLHRRLGLDKAEAHARAALLRRVSPRPVAPAEQGAAILTAPDLIAERGDDKAVTIRLARDDGPGVALDESLVRRALRQGFAPDLLAEARALLAALEQRGRTLRRIGDWLAAHQAGFFLYGPGAMRPATRAELAVALGLHPSTIGRAIAGKCIDVDGRLWPLACFFSTALGDDSGGVAAFAVQQRIRAMITAEPPDAPLSDEALARALRAGGVDIARRTVAKYRQGLRIPASSARRRQASSARHR